MGGFHPSALREGLVHLDRAETFDAAHKALKETAIAIGMPVLAWAPDVSRPQFDAHMDAFMRAEGWPEEVLSLWWSKTVMLKSPLYILCRTRSTPFATVDLDQAPRGQPALRQIASHMRLMGARALLTTPIHLPRGRVAMVTWGGDRSSLETHRLLAEVRMDLLVAGHMFMEAFQKMTGELTAVREEHSTLTPREWECLRFTAQGCREEEVARLVGMASTTVRYHLDNVVSKLGASNRTHAVALAAQLGLIGPIG